MVRLISQNKYNNNQTKKDVNISILYKDYIPDLYNVSN